MAIHSIYNGNLVTNKGSEWQFHCYSEVLPSEFSAYIQWSYGTPFTSDTIDDPKAPIQWINAGTGWLSDKIKFPLAAPYIVRCMLMDEAVGEEDYLEEFGFCEEDFCLEEPFIKHAKHPKEIMEAENSDGGMWTIVYPGAAKIDDAPDYIAMRTLGHLPIKFTIYGMSKKVYLTGKTPLNPIIKAKDHGKVDIQTNCFTRNNSGIDDPRKHQENGEGPTYNVYLKPLEIASGFIGASLYEKSPVIEKLDIETTIKMTARPMREFQQSAKIISEKYTKIKYMIDLRPDIFHFEDPGTPLNEYSMSDYHPFLQKGKEHLRGISYINGVTHTTRAIPTDHKFYNSNGNSLTLKDAARTFKAVKLRAQYKDKWRLALGGYLEGRVIGSRRGNAGVMYYKLRTNDLPTPIKGKLCVVRRNLSGRIRAAVHRNAPNVYVTISGLPRPTKPTELSYSGAAASILTTAGAIVVTVSVPWGIGLSLAGGIFNLLWAYTPSATSSKPAFMAEASVITSFVINDESGTQKVPWQAAIKKLSVRKNSAGKAYPINYVFSHHTVVGDLVRTEQIFNASIMHFTNKGHRTICRIGKGAFQKALEVGANS